MLHDANDRKVGLILYILCGSVGMLSGQSYPLTHTVMDVSELLNKSQKAKNLTDTHFLWNKCSCHFLWGFTFVCVICCHGKEVINDCQLSGDKQDILAVVLAISLDLF